MKKPVIHILLLLCLSYVAPAQNLIRNSGFEAYTLPVSSTYLEDVVYNWYAYFTTPDYFSLDIWSSATMEDYCGSLPHGGRAMVGGYQFGYFPDMPAYNREYIQGELTEPLKANTLYYAEMYVRPMLNRPVINWAVGNLGMAFTHAHCKEIDSTDAFMIREVPEVAYNGPAITDMTGWTRISGCFRAGGGETKIIIGNFKKDYATDTALLPGALDESDYRMSYYLFDDLLLREMPEAYISPADTLICRDSVIPLTVFPEGGQYAWNTGATTNPLRVSKEGTYTVDIITKEGCIQNASAIIHTKYCGPVCPGLYMPNAFSPNGDGRNDYFEPMNVADITNITLSIYNRWGERVFYTQSLKGKWDGRSGAQTCDAGTYFYDVRYKDCHGEDKARKGDLTLLR